jgi:ABC-type Fe3+-hydroxamate transport system substrate-binding protein
MSAFRFSQCLVAAAFGLLAAGVGCAGGDPPARAGHDDFGEPLPLGDPPRRIVSLSPTTTELLFALGAGDRLVGRTRWDLFPPAARAVPDLGDGIRPSIELLLAARPDLVILYASNDNRDAARALRAAGIRVVALRIDSIAEFFRTAEILGAVTGRPGPARAVVDSVSRSLEQVRAATAGLPRPTVFFHAYENPLLTIGAGSYLSELIDIGGGRNVFGDLPGPSPQVSFEEVLRRNPDRVLVSPVTAAELRASPRWRLLPAVRDDRVLVMDTTLVGRPGIRLGEAAWSLAELLHPGVRR